MKHPSTDNLLEDVQKCMTDPIYNVVKNFSLENSRKYYKKRASKWENEEYEDNPAVKREVETFPYADLEEMTKVSKEASTFMKNLESKDFFRDPTWDVRYDNIVITWLRLKTFDEWLHDWLYEALCMAYKMPEDGVRMILNKELWKWIYTNTAIHLYIDWKIDKETLQRMGQYEWYRKIVDRDIEEDIKQVRKTLEDTEEENDKKDVVVLTFKM